MCRKAFSTPRLLARSIWFCITFHVCVPTALAKLAHAHQAPRRAVHFALAHPFLHLERRERRQLIASSALGLHAAHQACYALNSMFLACR